MIRTVLTYALDAHAFTHTQVQRLETEQIVMIRRAIRTPAHIDKENNTKLREGADVYSLSSTLAYQRVVN